MEIVISVASMAIRKLNATRKRNFKVEKDLKNQTILITRILIMLLPFTLSLVLILMIGLLILDALITCVSKKISLKIFISIEKMKL